MSRFVSDSIQSFSLSMLSRVLGIGVGIVLARYLGPAGKGYVAYAVIILEIFVTAMNGVAQAVTYQFGTKGLPGAAVYRAMLRIVAAASIPSMLGVAIVAVAIPSQFPLIWVAAVIPFALYVQAATGIMVAADRISQTNVQRLILSSAGNLATVSVLVLLHADYRLVLDVWVASYVATAVYSWFAVRPFVAGEAPASRPIVREQLRFGFKSGAAQLCGYINMRIDVVVVSAMLGAQALGTYTLAVGMAELMWQISQPICMASFPRIATAPEHEAARFTAKVIRHVLMLLLPIAVVAFVIAPAAITFVYGPAFAQTGGAIRWIMPGVLAYAVEMPLGNFLMVRLGRSMLIVAIQTVSILICAGLTAATVRRWGIDGAAFATSLTYIGVVVVKGAVFRAATGVGVRELVLVRRDDLRSLQALARKLLFRAGGLIHLRRPA